MSFGSMFIDAMCVGDLQQPFVCLVISLKHCPCGHVTCGATLYSLPQHVFCCCPVKVRPIWQSDYCKAGVGTSGSGFLSPTTTRNLAAHLTLHSPSCLGNEDESTQLHQKSTVWCGLKSRPGGVLSSLLSLSHQDSGRHL